MRFLSLLFVAFALVFPHGALGAPSCSSSIDPSGQDHCVSKCKHKHKLGWSHHHKGNHTNTGYHTDTGNHPAESVVGASTTSTTSSTSTTPPPTSTTPPPTSTTPPPTSTPPANNPVPQNVADALSLHNQFRTPLGSKELTWSDNLANKAQEWADKCKFEHSGGSLGPFGENLAAGSGAFTFKDGFKLWVDEKSAYNSGNPQASHYTQVVWKATTEVGCACKSDCSGIFSSGVANFCVCEYNPPGNVIGEFGENVPK